MIVVVTDSDAMRAFEKVLIEKALGFTVVPKVWGGGRSGLHGGDRVHPGGESLLFTVVDEARAAPTLELLTGTRDAAALGDRTRIFSLPAEEVA